jgi:hypothetical protein
MIISSSSQQIKIGIVKRCPLLDGKLGIKVGSNDFVKKEIRFGYG